jgi:riboflavin synthase alpha subunit
MFTGIVREVGSVAAVTGGADGLRLELEAPATAPLVDVGGSVAINGVCLTAEAVEGSRLVFHAVPETLSRTTLGELIRGSAVNLEPALRAGDPLGGHLVSGHVDGVATVVSIEHDARSLRLAVEVPGPLARFIAPKGSVALDGVSLTVNRAEGLRCEVNLIPHTVTQTTFARIAVGSSLNLEVDQLARYALRALQH